MKTLNFDKNPFGVHKKMIYHTDRINEYLQTGDTFPIIMEINLTDICNLNCNYCFCDHRGKHILKLEVVIDFIDDFKKLGGKAITFSGGGESTLHKNFMEIVDYAYCNEIDLGLITNGAFKYNSDLLDVIGNCFKWVRISLDTVNKELYEKIKGKDYLDVVLANILLLKQYKCKLGINCNVTLDMKVHDVESLISILADRVDYIQFRPVLPRFSHKETIDLNNEVWDYLKTVDNNKVVLSYDKFVDLLYENNSFPFTSCEGHFFSPILDSNGDVKVCMYHPNNDNFTFGNINNKSLTDIWYSQKRKDVINYIRNLDYEKECQVCCKLAEINKFIDFIKYPDEQLDINFL